MTNCILSPPALNDLYALLERALIEEHLLSRGYDLEDLAALPEDEAKALWAEASRFASVKLAEVEARAHLVAAVEEHRHHL